MSVRILKYHLLTLIFGLNGMLLSGQVNTPVVESKIGTDSIRLGSQTVIDFSIATTEDYFWQWPVLDVQITEKIEMVSQTGIDTISQRSSNLLQLKKQIIITSFDTGYHAIPPFVFQYKLAGDTSWSAFETGAFLLYVSGLEVEADATIRDIKGPISAPLTLMEILPWMLLALLITGGILYYRHYLKKRRARASLAPKPAKPKIPPHTLAMDALEQLRQKKLWQSGRIKEYHTEITDILRHYLEGRFNIMAVEMTTSEIREITSAELLPSQAREKLLIIFERADLVKFAKSMPLPAEHEESFMLAVDFVRSTIPVVAEKETTVAGNTIEGITKPDENK
ncbi:MAG: hypothetical protein IH597_06290 [Bacteroidales bacterium]|nr:hypothetical protein [Bacteroidales bacterium]